MRALLVTALLGLTLTASAAAALKPADRAAINRTVDTFVNSAIKRQNVGAAWNIVTPNFRYGVSRASWDAGNLPVYPYPAKGASFHSWTVDSASPRNVAFELMIPSSRLKTDAIQYQGDVKKIGGRWLIDSFNPAATFAGGGTVVGPNDFTAASQGGGSGVAHLATNWVALPIGIVLLSLLCVGVWGLVAWLRNRRAYKQFNRRPLEPALVPKERGETDS
jgi:hypothetical protein